jgi:hypothetical protein
VPRPPFVWLRKMSNYLEVLTNAVRNYPNTYINFRIGDKIGRVGKSDIQAAINASNDANQRFDRIAEKKDVGNETQVYVNYNFRN